MKQTIRDILEYFRDGAANNRDLASKQQMSGMRCMYLAVAELGAECLV